MLNMETTGGSMYHESGFAGLQNDQHPSSVVSLLEHLSRSISREGKLPNIQNNAVVLCPASIFGPLLIK